MANQGGPPDLEEVLKRLLKQGSNKIDNSTKRERRNAPAPNPFAVKNRDNEVELVRETRKRPSLFFYLVTAFIGWGILDTIWPGFMQKIFSGQLLSDSGFNSDLPTNLPIIDQLKEFLGGINMFESMGFAVLVGAVVLLFLFLRSFVRIVPQNEAYVVERLGKYDRTLLAGFHITVPIIERVAYKHSLKEYAIDVASQHAITRDNVVLGIDGVLYLKIMDAKAASYGVENLQFAITQLAQTSMRAEIGKLSLDDTFESREVINAQVTRAIDEASEAWGTKVLRYEVKDITPPASILEEMEKQMGAERQRRVAVTTSEGYRQAEINQAEGDREAQILRAQGNAESLTIEATARAEAIRQISHAINEEGGSAAVAQQLAEQYVAAFDKLAREGTIALLPGDGSDVASMVAKAYTAFDGLKNTVGAVSSSPAGSRSAGGNSPDHGGTPS